MSLVQPLPRSTLCTVVCGYYQVVSILCLAPVYLPVTCSGMCSSRPPMRRRLANGARKMGRFLRS